MKRHPIFARFYSVMERMAAKAEAPYREETAGGAGGRVLEIGAGTGGNLPQYRAASDVVLLEPEPGMLGPLRERAAKAAEGGRAARVVRGAAESLPFEDDSFDTVVVSLVLCSVDDPARAAAEIKRVLTPTGSLRFYEHVRAAPGSKLERQQDRFERPWGLFAGGCHPNRDTTATLAGAGFDVRYRSFTMPRAWLAGPHVVGVARPEPIDEDDE